MWAELSDSDASVIADETEAVARSPPVRQPVKSKRAPLIFAKSIKMPWYEDVAGGFKFFEAVANTHTRRNGQFNRLQANDLFVVVGAGTKCRVAAVGVVAGPAHNGVADRQVLYSKLLSKRRQALDDELGDAPTFNYVTFEKVYNVQPLGIDVNELVRIIGAPQKKRAWLGFNLLSQNCCEPPTLLARFLDERCKCHQQRSNGGGEGTPSDNRGEPLAEISEGDGPPEEEQGTESMPATRPVKTRASCRRQKVGDATGAPYKNKEAWKSFHAMWKSSRALAPMCSLTGAYELTERMEDVARCVATSWKHQRQLLTTVDQRLDRATKGALFDVCPCVCPGSCIVMMSRTAEMVFDVHVLSGKELLALQGIYSSDYPQMHLFSNGLHRSLAGNAMSASVVMAFLYVMLSGGRL